MISDRFNTNEPPRDFEWDVETFVQAMRAGLFKENDRYELMDGRLLEMPTEQSHSIVSTLFFQALAQVFEAQWLV
ncbi:hypothetical protein EON81_16970 [bacterium]|nr:MAG: hypothetical protein EON81_16970 [bacterium]